MDEGSIFSRGGANLEIGTIKEATVRRFYYENRDQLRKRLASFVAAYNFARRLKTLKVLTPYEFICEAWTSQPERFDRNPLH